MWSYECTLLVWNSCFKSPVFDPALPKVLQASCVDISWFPLHILTTLTVLQIENKIESYNISLGIMCRLCYMNTKSGLNPEVMCWYSLLNLYLFNLFRLFSYISYHLMTLFQLKRVKEKSVNETFAAGWSSPWAIYHTFWQALR